jgi:hypothetical protein
VGDRFGGAIAYLFRNFVIIHIDISLSDSPILFQRPTIEIRRGGNQPLQKPESLIPRRLD